MVSKHKERVLQGVCGHCGKEKQSHLALCEKCLQINRERQKKLSIKRREQSLCRDCGVSVISGRVCEVCRKKRNINSITKRQDRLHNKLCYDCGKPVNQHKCRCDDCHDKQHVALMEKRENRKAKGLCVRCGKSDKMCNSVCEMCYFKIASVNAKMGANNWKTLKEVFDRQSGICPYTKRKIVLGVDASIDHKIPTSKGGTNEASNLQWIYSPVNPMKLDHSEDDFFGLIKELYEKNKERMGL